MKKRNFLLLLAILLIGICCLYYCCRPKDCCCELEAPNSLTATVTGPITVELDWDSVPGAVAYQINVKNITSNTTLPLLTAVGTDTLLTELTPDNEYTVIVQAICDNGKECKVSSNGAAVCFKPRGVIVEDVVVMAPGVMGGSGMDDCETCDIVGTGQVSSPISVANDLPLPGTSARVIFKFKIVHSAGPVKYFKLAFDGTCREEIKVLDCTPNDTNIGLTLNGNTLQFHDKSATLLLTLTPTSDGTVTFNGSGCTVQYVKCAGNWATYCQ